MRARESAAAPAPDLNRKPLSIPSGCGADLTPTLLRRMQQNAAAQATPPPIGAGVLRGVEKSIAVEPLAIPFARRQC